MINWIIAFFYFLGTLGIFDIEQILFNNLIIILICRGLYVFGYTLFYGKYSNDALERESLFSKEEIIYFGIKQIIVILFGMLYFPITIFLSFYSLLMFTYYFLNIGKTMNSKMLNIFGNLSKILIPLIGILWFLFINLDYYALSAIALSLLIFLVYGLKNSSLSLTELIEKYSKRRLAKIPAVFKYLIMLFLVAFPSSIIVATAFFTPQSKSTYMIEMRDGVRLATDVYYAPGSYGTPRPVILVRTPYGKEGWAYELYSQVYFIQNYHLVIQDLRGTHDSEGGNNFLLFTKSYEDGLDTLEWISAQPFCNGYIASVGVSALCINQYFYAGMGPNGLKAQQLWFGTPELFDHAIYQGSYHKSSVETWVKSTAPNNWEHQLDMIFKYYPKNDILYNSTSLSIPLGPHYSNVTAYGIHVGGWYDHFLQGTIDGYIGYDDNGTSRAKGHQKLIMGPWTHGEVFGGKQGELTYPENSNGFDMILNWETEIFDEALLGIPADWSGARVAYYMMGDVDVNSPNWNYWRYAYDWPLKHVNDKWFFTADGRLDNTSAGLLNKNFSYIFDPRNPVPTLGGQNQPFDLNGPIDQRPIEDRSDVIVFETPWLTEAVEVVGRIFGHIFITSNCTDTDFTIKLTDVYPDNRSMLITDGSLTVRHRFNYTSEAFMSGNLKNVYELLIDCWSTAYTFAPGHKIRVVISSSNYPRYGINPNTGAPLATNYLNYNLANNTLLVGPAYNSSIILPRLINMDSTHVSY
jgi:predicted acyl esterase